MNSLSSKGVRRQVSHIGMKTASRSSSRDVLRVTRDFYIVLEANVATRLRPMNRRLQ
jgi:hypothetical protein